MPISEIMIPREMLRKCVGPQVLPWCSREEMIRKTGGEIAVSNHGVITVTGSLVQVATLERKVREHLAERMKAHTAWLERKESYKARQMAFQKRQMEPKKPRCPKAPVLLPVRSAKDEAKDAVKAVAKAATTASATHHPPTSDDEGGAWTTVGEKAKPITKTVVTKSTKTVGAKPKVYATPSDLHGAWGTKDDTAAKATEKKVAEATAKAAEKKVAQATAATTALLERVAKAEAKAAEAEAKTAEAKIKAFLAAPRPYCWEDDCWEDDC